ncbi:MAG: hypothetical protein H2046_05535 [Rhizobiales bacterium]|nr:hypothetical protein [Hyphomicrobiales bacterium]
MKVSRTGNIIASAERRTSEIIESIPDGKMKRTAESVDAICAMLVKRRTPLLPSAPLVAEEGRNRNPDFPAHQTIYNRYSEILKVWREAYYDVLNIDAEVPASGALLEKIDTSLMDSSTAAIVNQLVVIVREVTQRNNVLKQIIDRLTATSGNHPALGDQEEVLILLGRWIRALADNPVFQLDEFGLKVSRRTVPNTRIIDADLLERLLRFADDFERSREARRAID